MHLLAFTCIWIYLLSQSARLRPPTHCAVVWRAGYGVNILSGFGCPVCLTRDRYATQAKEKREGTQKSLPCARPERPKLWQLPNNGRDVLYVVWYNPRPDSYTSNLQQVSKSMPSGLPSSPRGQGTSALSEGGCFQKVLSEKEACNPFLDFPKRGIHPVLYPLQQGPIRFIDLTVGELGPNLKHPQQVPGRGTNPATTVLSVRLTVPSSIWKTSPTSLYALEPKL